ncbi:MAG: LCP family protein, partial [Clostridium sp.]
GSKQLTKSGNVHLNGKQALAFSRIRKIDSDAARSSRQREVLMALFKKGKAMDITKLPTVARDVSSTIETNISLLDLIDIGTLLLSMNFDQLDELRLPLDGTTSHFLNGVYHLNWDEEVNKKAMHDFIFGPEQ